MNNYGPPYPPADRPSLSIGERIVWISDNGPEYGNVRWLGKLPDLGREWMAGVEFDNPVGSGTGLYKDKQLFVTSLNHASLVPVIGLLKASDFDEPPTAAGRSSLDNLIEMNQESDQENDFRHTPRYGANDTHRRPQSNNQTLLPSRYYTQSSKTNKIPALSSKASDNRVRHIPIELERDHEPYETNQSQASFATQRHTSSGRSVRANDEQSLQEHIRDISSALISTNLNDNRTEGLPMLPPPPYVVPAGATNPKSMMDHLLGKSRGIQGHNNSCYLDATLFAMFSSTTLFDSLLYRPPNRGDIATYSEIQRILREEVVRPLRTKYIVSAEQVMKFRTMLERSSTVEGLTDEEKDPEEFLNLLLGQILKAEPYLKLSSGLESFFYQLFVEKDENIVLPTVQDLFEQSFIHSAVRLREIPPCLLLQMPRFGRQYKMYSRIMPSLKLDITDILEAVPRACGHKGKDCDTIACYECKDCFGERPGRSNARLASITYCANCFKSKHFGKFHQTGIEDHDRTKTVLDKTPADAISRYSSKGSLTKDKEIPRICMDLFAVLCIETSHYVCFVKCGPEPDAPWCFFDSMADRSGEQNGYNIPEVLMFEEFQYWISEKGISQLLNQKDDKQLPEMTKRLICDAYLCFYQYTGLTTYR